MFKRFNRKDRDSKSEAFEDDFLYKKPQVICELRDWVYRRNMNSIYHISGEVGRNEKRGVYINIDKKKAKDLGIHFRVDVTSQVFIETPMTENGIDISRAIDFLRFYGVGADWVIKSGDEIVQEEDLEFIAISRDMSKQPKTLQEVIDWIQRTGKDKLFHIHDELYFEESTVVYITVADNAEEYGLPPISGTHAIPLLKEEGKEWEHVIGFLFSFGVNPDWQ